MKFTITPLGGGEPRRRQGRRRHRPLPPTTPQGAPTPSPGGPEGPSRYYADSGEEPGRWLGEPAPVDRAWQGTVDRTDFASVLAGRDPRTGERLITAQGSAGQAAEAGGREPHRDRGRWRAAVRRGRRRGRARA